MKLIVIGMDIAKHVVQLHAVNPYTGEIEYIKLRRSQLLEFFGRRERSPVAIEACGGAHHWARQVQHLGHDVMLICACSVQSIRVA
ncbi:hypothetical protein CS8_088370 [Cupriavidus sp. 8B]